MDWVVLAVGMATLFAGASLAVLGSRAFASARVPLRHSFLSPILAMDVLDADLRVAYARTLVLDARADEDLVRARIHLGAEIRRLILDVQAVRASGRWAQIDWDAIVEPPDDWAAHKVWVRSVREDVKKQAGSDESDPA